MVHLISEQLSKQELLNMMNGDREIFVEVGVYWEDLVRAGRDFWNVIENDVVANTEWLSDWNFVRFESAESEYVYIKLKLVVSADLNDEE